MKRLNQKRENSIGYLHQPISKYQTHQVQNQDGDGIFSSIGQKISSTLSKRPKVLNDLFETDGDIKIIKIEVCRVPIFSVFRKLLNFLSLGKLNREMKKLNYDELFHLYCIIYLQNGKVYSIEKNQKITVLKGAKKDKNSKCLGITFTGKTLKEFLVAPEENHLANLYQYDAFLYNCQHYQRTLFNANGITQFDTFITQKVDTLVPGIIKKISKGITNIAGIAETIYRGGGVDDDEIVAKY